MAIAIAKRVSNDEASALRGLLEKLLEIRESGLSATEKARAALSATRESGVVLAAVKTVARELKTLGWDNRTKAQRAGLGAAAVGLGLFGSQAAGIAALGTAIAVPLWVVLGAGSMFGSYLYDELKPKAKEDREGDIDKSPVIDIEPVARSKRTPPQ